MENVYSQVKMFHFHDKLEHLKKSEVTVPIHLRIKPINACNHRCFYCCYRSESLFLGQLMNEKDMIPREKMLEIVDDVCISGVKAVTFTGGGEPLIYPYISETVEKLLAGDVKVAVLTNGSALKGRVGDVLAHGASWVRISIDGADPKSFAESRNVKPEEFDKIIANIEKFTKMKHATCELGINFIVTKMNAGGVYDFIRMAKQAGVDHVKISECIVSTVGEKNNTYHAAHSKDVLEQIHRAEECLSDDGFRVINKFHDFDDKYEKQYTWCPFIHFLNVIGADSTVYTCQDKAYTETGILGSIKNQSLRELWNSQEYGNRLMEVNPSKVCNHHCVQHGKNTALLDFLSTDSHHLEFV